MGYSFANLTMRKDKAKRRLGFEKLITIVKVMMEMTIIVIIVLTMMIIMRMTNMMMIMIW